MRVVAGKFRSRPLAAPRGLATRPTSDRLRETLFNVLAPRIEGAVFADLYAGSGAVGIEAISRGARLVCFAENAPPAVAAIRANLASLGISSGFAILRPAAATAVRQMPEPCDIIFLDPPYEDDSAYAATLGAIGRGGALAPGGIAIAEHRRRQPLEERYGRLLRFRVLEQGDAALSFYRVGEEAG